MGGHNQKMAIYEPGSRLLSHTQSVDTLILDILDCRTVRKKCLFFKPASLWYFCYSSLNRLSKEEIFLFILLTVLKVSRGDSFQTTR